MKKLSCIIVSLFLLFSCKQATTSDVVLSETTPSTAEVAAAIGISSPTAIPATNATSSPADPEAAEDLLFVGFSMLSLNSYNDSAKAAASIARAAAPASGPHHFSEVFKIGEGTVKITGKMNLSSYFNEEAFVTFTPNTKYPGLFSSSSSLELISELTQVPVTEKDTPIATVSGKTAMALDMNISLDYETQATINEKSKFYLNFMYNLKYGAAISVINAQNIGAKYIISYNGNIDLTRIDVSDDDGTEESPMLVAMVGAMNSLVGKEASVKVFNDANVLIHELNIPLEDIPNAILGFNTKVKMEKPL